MDLMQVRRRMMLRSAKELIDTSPKIVEYGKGLAYAQTGERWDNNFCITEWYPFDVGTVNPIHLYNKAYVTQYVRACNYQYYGTNADGAVQRDWYYNKADDPERYIGWNTYTLKEIRFSIPIKEIDDSFAYVEETGQIFFAGKNSPYYGYTNINDMP